MKLKFHLTQKYSAWSALEFTETDWLTHTDFYLVQENGHYHCKPPLMMIYLKRKCEKDIFRIAMRHNVTLIFSVLSNQFKLLVHNFMTNCDQALKLLTNL